jgi:hypothetical protein
MWADRLVGNGGASAHAGLLLVILLAVVLLGSWAQSRIAQS